MKPGVAYYLLFTLVLLFLGWAVDRPATVVQTQVYSDNGLCPLAPQQTRFDACIAHIEQEKLRFAKANFNAKVVGPIDPEGDQPYVSFLYNDTTSPLVSSTGTTAQICRDDVWLFHGRVVINSTVECTGTKVSLAKST